MPYIFLSSAVTNHHVASPVFRVYFTTLIWLFQLFSALQTGKPMHAQQSSGVLLETDEVGKAVLVSEIPSMTLSAI
jgi:hypothetical protein